MRRQNNDRYSTYVNRMNHTADNVIDVPGCYHDSASNRRGEGAIMRPLLNRLVTIRPTGIAVSTNMSDIQCRCRGLMLSHRSQAGLLLLPLLLALLLCPASQQPFYCNIGYEYLCSLLCCTSVAVIPRSAMPPGARGEGGRPKHHHTFSNTRILFKALASLPSS